MLKRFSIKKISKYTILLLIVFLFYLFPSKNKYSLENTVGKEIKANYHDIFLLDKNGYVSKTDVEVSSLKKDKLIEELISIMTIDGKYQDKIPNGFNSLLPCDTILINKEIKDNVVILNFSKELLELTKEMEEKAIESIIYTMTSIKDIDKVKILVDNKILKKLPKSGKILDEELSRDYGINKSYNVNSIKNISKVTIYYTSKTNNNDIYYVPVTKYSNRSDDKIKIIIDELTSKISYESNLMSYLNYNAKLLDYSITDDEIDLNFNEYLFDNDSNKKVLEEVIYTISYSIHDNYDVDIIKIYVNNKEIK